MANYMLLGRVELNASASSVTFANIPQTGYTDLKIVYSARTTVASPYANALLRFNRSTSSYTMLRLYGDGASVSSYSNTDIFDVLDGGTATANIFGIGEYYISNYTNSVSKSVLGASANEQNATTAQLLMTTGLWADNSAINSISLTPTSGSFVQYSTFSLYGLAAVGATPAIMPKATGGNITNDGTYWYHTFLSSSYFTPLTTLSCDYLVVAGGGAGGGDQSGGGAGAGGLRSTVGATGGGGSLESPISVSAQSYAVTVGAGGASRNISGNNSTFSTITSIGGGYGGNGGGLGGATGGSGGGGSYNSSPGSGTSGQGYAGGTGASGGYYTTGGGGGAGAVGQNAPSNTVAGAGGAGVLLTTWSNATGTGASGYYAGGGGQGGQSNTFAVDGTVNTGGGGGGVTGGRASAQGGSGIVIIRYAMS